MVAENFSARVMASWGLDYPRMKEIRAGYYHGEFAGFRPDRPAARLCQFRSDPHVLFRHDLSLARPGNRAARRGCQTAFPDYVAPSYGALAILAALHYRARTGKGQYIDISQAETAASMIGPALFGISHQWPRTRAPGKFQRHGGAPWLLSLQRRRSLVRHRRRTQEEWMRFCEIVGHREWLTDARFADPTARVANRAELDAAIEAWTAKYTPHQVMLILQRDGIAAGVVQTAEDLYRDPHLRERGFAREVYSSRGRLGHPRRTVGAADRQSCYRR